MSKRLSSFTLIEQLLVLLITASIIFLGAVQFQSVKATFVENHFIQAFEARYLYTQKMALIMGANTEIHYKKINQEIRCIVRSNHVIKERFILHIPKTIQIKSAPNELIFSGGTGRSGTLRTYLFQLNSNNKEVKYVVQMGDGKYVKTEKKL